MAHKILRPPVDHPRYAELNGVEVIRTFTGGDVPRGALRCQVRINGELIWLAFSSYAEYQALCPGLERPTRGKDVQEPKADSAEAAATCKANPIRA